MQRENYLCPIVAKEELRDRLFSISVQCLPVAKAALAGQFLHIACGEAHLLRRPISICNVEGDTVRFVFEVRGEGTKWLSKQLKGASLDIIGPLGNGFSGEAAGRILFIGGGIGMFPLYLAMKRANGEKDGVFGFQTKNAVVMEGALQTVLNKLVITTDDGSYGEAGFVTQHAAALLEQKKYDKIISCGPQAMLKAVAKLAETYSVPCEISLEERMGCGIGACLVCACKIKKKTGESSYLHVCKDGPVFKSQEVDFDD